MAGRGGYLGRVGVLAGACWLALSALALAQEPYRLHPQDKLLLRVMTWDFARTA